MVRLISIAELHDYMGSQGRDLGMPLDKFTDEAYKKLVEVIA